MWGEAQEWVGLRAPLLNCPKAAPLMGEGELAELLPLVEVLPFSPQPRDS